MVEQRGRALEGMGHAHLSTLVRDVVVQIALEVLELLLERNVDGPRNELLEDVRADVRGSFRKKAAQGPVRTPSLQREWYSGGETPLARRQECGALGPAIQQTARRIARATRFAGPEGRQNSLKEPR
jgi:hypothetical protein